VSHWRDTALIKPLVKMFARLLQLRYIYLVAVVITFINSLFFLWNGVVHAFHGYVAILYHKDTDTRPGLHFVESFDMFMIAFMFLIFSLGMMRIFTHYHVHDEKLPGWLRIDSFKELKILLWETILLTLVIVTISEVIKKLDHLTWEVLFLPGVILLLSLSLFIVRKEEKHDDEKHK
jgi:uncharacterized membrane protein YqhA